MSKYVELWDEIPTHFGYVTSLLQHKMNIRIITNWNMTIDN
jgi:hypothetical protein